MASRKQRKAKLDALSDEEVFDSGGIISRHGGGVRDEKGWTPQQKRDANIKRVLDDADGKHGDFVDGHLGLTSDDEQKRQREVRNARRNQAIGALGVIVALLGLLYQAWTTGQQFKETKAQFKRQDARLERERRAHLIEILYESTKGEDGKTVAKYDARTRLEAVLEFIAGEREAIEEFEEGMRDVAPRTIHGRIDLNWALLADIDLRGHDLHDLSFVNARFTRANLYETNLAGTDLSGAKLHWCFLKNADLDGANLTLADFSNSRLLPSSVDLANVWNLKGNAFFKEWAIGHGAVEEPDLDKWEKMKQESGIFPGR